jgi:hypothetical protein
MRNKSRAGGKCDATVAANHNASTTAKAGGIFEVECVRDGKVVWTEKMHNLLTNEGRDDMVDVVIKGGSQITTWYVAVFEDDHTVAAGDTYAVPGYTESTAYDEANRPSYQEGAISGGSVDNDSNKAQFTFNATKTIYGASLVGGGGAPTTKGDTAGGGVLLCAGQFAASRAVYDDDVLYVKYTFSVADDGV